MKLLTQAIKDQLPALYAQEKKGNDAVAFVKFFTPDSNWTWWATEYDPEEGLFFGLVSGFEVELGYFSLSELEAARGPLGLAIERDKWWEPTTIGEIRKSLQS